jgi:hypothetical protein
LLISPTAEASARQEVCPRADPLSGPEFGHYNGAKKG